MPHFKYKGISAQGGEVSGVVEALGHSAALRNLAQRNVQVFALDKTKSAAQGKSGKKPRSVDYFRVLDQLGVLLSADIPILDAVESLADMVANQQIARELNEVLVLLRRGERLGSALQTAIPTLPVLVPNLIKLGEQTGDLPKVLTILTSQLGMREKIKSDIQGALVYPAFLLTMGLTAVVFLMYVVVPRFSKMLAGQSESLPLVSKIVFGISTFLTENTAGVVALAGIAVLGSLATWHNKAARRTFERSIYAAPVIGQMLRDFQLANWTRTVGVAFGAHANLLNAVTLAAESISEANTRSFFDQVSRSLRSGSSLDDALAKVPGIESTIVNLVRTGVKAGRLADMLLLATKILDERVENSAKRIGRLAEPVAMLFISAIVGVTVLALVSAMTSMYDFFG